MNIRNRRLSPKSQVLGIRRGMLTDRIEAIRVAKSKEIGLELTTPQILTMLVAMYENRKR